MANEQHLEILRQGVDKWNEWRKHGNTLEYPDLTGADLHDINLSGADLSWARFDGAVLTKAKFEGAKLYQASFQYANLDSANMISANMIGIKLVDAFLGGATLLRANLENADMRGAILVQAKMKKANLTNASLDGCDLYEADLTCADCTGAFFINASLENARLESTILAKANLENASLVGANLENASLDFANLTGADLSGANLTLTDLVETNFTNATITGCGIYGISAWNVNLENTIQKDLIISKKDEPVITVDDLAVAQFIYLILNNKNIRNVLDSITSKGVLILGRFSDPQRKEVLDGLREKLRHFDLLPIVFDFDRPTDKDYTETVQTLAGMSMFVIADLTSPKSTPLELEATVKQFKIPYVPIIDISVDKRPFAMLVDLQKSFHWVLPTIQYELKEDLLDDDNLKNYILDPVIRKREELRKAKNTEPEIVLIRKKIG